MRQTWQYVFSFVLSRYPTLEQVCVMAQFDTGQRSYWYVTSAYQYCTVTSNDMQHYTFVRQEWQEQCHVWGNQIFLTHLNMLQNPAKFSQKQAHGGRLDLKRLLSAPSGTSWISELKNTLKVDRCFLNLHFCWIDQAVFFCTLVAPPTRFNHPLFQPHPSSLRDFNESPFPRLQLPLGSHSTLAHFQPTPQWSNFSHLRQIKHFLRMVHRAPQKNNAAAVSLITCPDGYTVLVNSSTPYKVRIFKATSWSLQYDNHDWWFGWERLGWILMIPQAFNNLW